MKADYVYRYVDIEYIYIMLFFFLHFFFSFFSFCFSGTVAILYMFDEKMGSKMKRLYMWAKKN
jgi:hypothetical protein